MAATSLPPTLPVTQSFALKCAHTMVSQCITICRHYAQAFLNSKSAKRQGHNLKQLLAPLLLNFMYPLYAACTYVCM